MKAILFTITLLTVLGGFQASAVAADDVAALLAADAAPAGVVFEIVSGDADRLGKLLPGLRTDIERLRARFPGLPVAVVSHGEEQFALTTENRAKEPELHAIAEDMVTGKDVDLHVCGTYAGWFGVDPGEFPNYVDVAATGPAQINDYRALGYVLITLP
ncbi:MAG: DsrE family protein [Gammaproteobacteria bacterium]